VRLPHRSLLPRTGMLAVALPALMLGCNGNGCSEEQTANNQDQCRAAIFEDTETAGAGDLEPDFGDFLAEHAVASPGGGWVVEGDMHFTSTQHR